MRTVCGAYSHGISLQGMRPWTAKIVRNCPLVRLYHFIHHCRITVTAWQPLYPSPWIFHNLPCPHCRHCYCGIRTLCRTAKTIQAPEPVNRGCYCSRQLTCTSLYAHPLSYAALPIRTRLYLEYRLAGDLHVYGNIHCLLSILRDPHPGMIG